MPQAVEIARSLLNGVGITEYADLAEFEFANDALDAKCNRSRIPQSIDTKNDVKAPIMFTDRMFDDDTVRRSPTAKRLQTAHRLWNRGFEVPGIEERRACISESFLLESVIATAIPSIHTFLMGGLIAKDDDPLCEDHAIVSIVVYNILGLVSEQLKQGRKAAEIIARRGAIHPRSKDRLKLARVYFLLGGILSALGKNEEALKCLLDSYDLEQDDHRSLYGASVTQKQMGRLTEAKTGFAKFIERAPRCHKSYSEAFYYMAEIAFNSLNNHEFCYYFEKGFESESFRLPFMPEVDCTVKDVYFGMYLATDTSSMFYCSSCLKLGISEDSLTKSCKRCRRVSYCNRYPLQSYSAHYTGHRSDFSMQIMPAETQRTA